MKISRLIQKYLCTEKIVDVFQLEDHDLKERYVLLMRAVIEAQVLHRTRYAFTLHLEDVSHLGWSSKRSALLWHPRLVKHMQH